MPELSIIIDRRRCAGEGICVDLAPEVFDFDDEGVAIARAPDALDAETLLEIAQRCPQEAITIIDLETEERLVL